MKPIGLIIIYLIFISITPRVFSQSFSDTIENNYSPSVVSQVFDLYSKVNLDEAKQIDIANLFEERDEQIQLLLSTNTPTDQIIMYRDSMNELIHNTLDNRQKYDLYVANIIYSQKHKYTYSQFAIALRYRDGLELNEVQINTLYDRIAELKTMKNDYYEEHRTSYDTRDFESRTCTEILTESQYDLLLRMKNESKARSFANSDWNELEGRLLDGDYEKDVVIGTLTEYYIIRESIYDKYRHDLITQKAEAREWYINRPQVLKALQRARRSPQNDTINGGFNGGGD